MRLSMAFVKPFYIPWNRKKQNKLITVTRRNTGCQGSNKFHLLLVDFRYRQYRKLKEMSGRDQGLAFIIGGFPLLLGPV